MNPAAHTTKTIAATHALAMTPHDEGTVDFTAHEAAKGLPAFSCGCRTATFIPVKSGERVTNVPVKDVARIIASTTGSFVVAGIMQSARAAAFLADIERSGATIVGVVWNYDSPIANTTERLFKIVLRR